MEDEIAIVRALADPTHVHDRVRQQCSSAADKAQRAATVLSPVPHDGVVFADETYSCTVVTHMLTCEKLAMPSTGWTMSFDEDGFAAVLPPADGPHADDEPVVLEDAFRFQLHKAATGGLFIVGSSGSEQVDLGSLMQLWESKDLTLELGATNAKKKFNGALFRWPRMPGARFIWSMKSLYTELNFQQFSGQPWRWADSGWRRWRKTLDQEFHLSEHVVPSGLSKETLGVGGGS